MEVTNYMKKRMLSMFLALLTICGLIPTTAFAAPTLDEAMAEVDVYLKDKDIVYLTSNGKVQNQKYTTTITPVPLREKPRRFRHAV